MGKIKAVPIALSFLWILTACAAPALRASTDQGFEVSEGVPVIVERESVAGSPGAEPQVSFAGDEISVERLVIRNANLTLVVEDPAVSVAEISQLAVELGGFVVSSNVYQTTFDDNLLANRASITIRVPADRLDETLDQIKKDAVEIRNESVSGQDVTQEFTDLQSQLRNLEAAEEELREIMDVAVDSEDVLRVFEHLRQVRQEIEIIKGRIQYLDQSARLSAISVELLPDVVTRPLQIGRWEPQGTAKAALEALIQALQYIVEAAIWGLICILPVGLLFGVPGWFVFRAVRRRRKTSQKQDEVN